MISLCDISIQMQSSVIPSRNLYFSVVSFTMGQQSFTYNITAHWSIFPNSKFLPIANLYETLQLQVWGS